MNKGALLVLSGPSGVGKGTVLAEVLKKYSPDDLFFSVSVTTRDARPGEKDGVNYHYITREKFDDILKNDGLLEHNIFCGTCYGTPVEPVKKALAGGKLVILEIDVNGMRQVVKKFPDAVTVFISPPSKEELERRIRGRGTESEEQLTKRLGEAARELKAAKEYKYVVVNDDFDKAVGDLSEIIKKHYK